MPEQQHRQPIRPVQIFEQHEQTRVRGLRGQLVDEPSEQLEAGRGVTVAQRRAPP